MFDKIKQFLSEDTVFYSALLVLIGVTSFGLGRWSMVGVPAADQPAGIIMASSRPGLELEESHAIAAGAAANAAAPTPAPAASHSSATGAFVGSKNSDKYHLPYCPGANRIKDANKIWFASKEEAASRGYTPAANCPGL